MAQFQSKEIRSVKQKHELRNQMMIAIYLKRIKYREPTANNGWK